MELFIGKKERRTFQLIISAYSDVTILPKKDNWKQKIENELWLHHIGQVMVVGGEMGKRRFDANPSLQEQLSLEHLKSLSGEDELLQTINRVLRAVGTRYAAKDYRKCQKSKSLLHNLQFITSNEGGLKGILQALHNFEGESKELERVHYLMQHLRFMKSKSARDFLMGLGMNEQTLAIDIRIQNIFRHMDIAFPSAAQLGSEKLYREVEAQIIQKVCQPLNILPVHFDRLLFQHYQKIIRSDYLLGRLF